MSYTRASGSAVSIRHPVRALDGTSLLAGHAADVTYRITSPAGAVTTTGITWTEPNADGWLLGAISLAALGVWIIEVNNATSAGGTPITGSDGGTYRYDVDMVASAAGITPAGSFLTTEANFKEMVENAETDAAYIANLIARATQRIERLVGRTLVQATYTERYDGRGHVGLNLRKGPIQSVTYVADVVYSAAGVASTSSIAAGSYLVRGKAADGWNLPGWLEYSAGAWVRGQQNYEVQYSAGFAAVPYDLEEACLELCVWMWNQRKSVGLTTREAGTGLQTFRGADELLDKLRGELEPYVDARGA